MKVIVIPDGYEIRAVPDEGTGCKSCIFHTTELNDDEDAMGNYCLLNPANKLPCVDTIYMVLRYLDDDELPFIM